MPPAMYQVRLRASAKELMTTASDWSLKCEKMLMYEHSKNEKNIHCHFLLVGVYDSTDTLKNCYKKHGLLLKGAGQVMFAESFKLPDKTVVRMTAETVPKYITYMSKGQYEPSYNKGFTTEEIALAKSQWVDHASDPPSPDTLLREDFSNHLYEYCKSHQIDIDALRIREIRSLAVRFSVNLTGGSLNAYARKTASMLYSSYGYNNGMLTAEDIILPYEPLVHKKK